MFWIEFREFLKDSFKVILVLLILFLIIVYVFSITQVVGDSMYPNLKNKEILILNKMAYRLGDVEREDIVSLSYDNTKYLIKRVIGMPGDTLEIKDSKLYINNKVYEEDYIDETLVYEDFKLSDIGYDVIPEDMYFVLGDNRPDSLDSRKIGLVKKKDIDGEIVFRFWPFKRVGFIN